MSRRTDYQDKFAKLISQFILELQSRGYQVVTGEYYRTPEQAMRNAAEGKGIEHSLHTICMAADLPLWKDGVYLKDTEDYQEAGDIWKSMDSGCNWGGDFASLPDGNHFSLSYPFEGFENVK